jgi:hypothetical protein
VPITTVLPKNLQAAYLAAFTQSGDLELAATCADTTPDEVRRTMKLDAEFAKACGKARAEWISGHVSNVAKAGARDWKASMAILERHPETRDRYAPPTVKTESRLTLDVNRMSDEELLAKLNGVTVQSLHGAIDTEAEELPAGDEPRALPAGD